MNSTLDQPNSSWRPNLQAQTSLIFSLILFSAYAIIFLIGFIANIFVIVVIIKCRRMRTLTNRFLLNLAVSDLLATLICLPPTAYHHYDKRWIFGEFLCRFVPFIQGTSVAVSIFTLMAVSVDRFIAIHKPIHAKLLCTPTRIVFTIIVTWFIAFLLMIPLIVHHRIVDPFDITLTACAEEWQQNMNARLAYDFLLLTVLFIIPLTLMTYCYVRISFALWFIDSNVSSSISSSSSVSNLGRYSMISEDFPQLDLNDPRGSTSAQKRRPYYIHYHKAYENDLKRKSQQHIQQATQVQQEQQQQQQQTQQQTNDVQETRPLMNAMTSELTSNPSRHVTTVNDVKPKSYSISATTITTAPSTSRRSSSLIGRRLVDNGYDKLFCKTSNIHHGRQGSKGNAGQRHSSPYNSGIIRSSVTSLQSHHRIMSNPGRTINGTAHHRSIVEFERASRFLQSRRRVVKLLITLVVIFFVTRLPLHILSIYIDITSNTFLPENTFRNSSRLDVIGDATAVLSSSFIKSDRKMILVLYVNPILQLMSLSNSALNPICYCMMSHAVKHIFTVLRQKFRRRGQNKSGSLPLSQRAIPLNHSMKIPVAQRNSFALPDPIH